MSDASLRFSSWFQRWWIALIGAVVSIGGFVIHEAAEWSIPRGVAEYYSSSPTPDYVWVERFGEIAMLAGLVAVVAAVAWRLAVWRRAEKQAS